MRRRLCNLLHASRPYPCFALSYCRTWSSGPCVRSLSAVPLFDGLQHLTLLTKLDLESSRLTGAGALYLGQALRYLPELTSLLLKGLPYLGEGEMTECLGPAGLRHVADGLRHNDQDLSYARMGDEGAAALASALGYVTKLVRLYLDNNFVSSDAAGSIFAALQHTPSSGWKLWRSPPLARRCRLPPFGRAASRSTPHQPRREVLQSLHGRRGGHRPRASGCPDSEARRARPELQLDRRGGRGASGRSDRPGEPRTQ